MHHNLPNWNKQNSSKKGFQKFFLSCCGFSRNCVRNCVSILDYVLGGLCYTSYYVIQQQRVNVYTNNMLFNAEIKKKFPYYYFIWNSNNLYLLSHIPTSKTFFANFLIAKMICTIKPFSLRENLFNCASYQLCNGYLAKTSCVKYANWKLLALLIARQDLIRI